MRWILAGWLGVIVCCPTQPAQGQEVIAERVATGLGDPVGVTNAGDSRLFVVGQQGLIRIVKGGTVLVQPFLDLSAEIATDSIEQGLLGLAFHPQYPAIPYFFVSYTAKDTGNVTLMRYSVSANPDFADPGSGRLLLSVPHSNAPNHNSGQLQFGPGDGYLYMGVGDGGGSCDNTDHWCNAQNKQLLLGKILRLDIDSSANQSPYYAVPPDNPFVVEGGNAALIWALGLRNPWRFSFDRQAPYDLYIGDVGQNTREEIDHHPGNIGGLNYGWPLVEGTLCKPCAATQTRCPAPTAACQSFEAPVYDYDHSEGYAVIGGYVYRGGHLPGLTGSYIYSDYGSGKIWELDEQGRRTEVLQGFGGLTSFGQDWHGELYFVLQAGELWRLAASQPLPAFPSRAWPVALLFLALVRLQRRKGVRERREPISP